MKSTKKAIVKTKGPLKDSYSKRVRRSDNKILKNWIEGSRYLSPHSFNYDEDEEFFNAKEKFKDKGMSDEEAHEMANWLVEYNLFWSTMSSNLFRLWWEEPEFINPKTLINNADYRGYTAKVEFDSKSTIETKKKYGRK